MSELNKQILAGADMMSGKDDPGYSVTTWEKHDEFVKKRNKSYLKLLVREWAEQAGSTYKKDFGYQFNEHELEKFAELIAKECANIVADAVEHREPASTYVDKIKQHFGVEE
jgi:hypothetical protein